MKSAQELINWNRDKWELKNQLMYANGNTQNQWPWFNESLDPDIKSYIQANHNTKATILDLGTCSGSQAIELANMGHQVIGSDISETALSKAVELAKQAAPEASIQFVLDDVLTSKLPKNTFDLILDRGCFHSVCYFGANEYIENVYNLLRPDGKIILKAMSADESRFINYDDINGQKLLMPCRFTKALVEKIFSPFFIINKLEDSFFYSTQVSPPAKAIVAVLTKKPLKDIKL